jgi:hypothetical protein
MPYCLYVRTLRADRIEEITSFVTPETIGRQSLPEAVPG